MWRKEVIDVDLNVKLQPGDGQKLREDLNQNFTLLQYEDEKDDSALQEEEDARRNADSREIQARQAEDNNLQSQVDALRRRLDTDEKNIGDLQAWQKVAMEQIAKLNEIIFGTEYINDTDDIPLDDSMIPGKEVEISDTDVINDDKAEVAPLKDYTTLDNEIN